jgi:hypothetical protein
VVVDSGSIEHDAGLNKCSGIDGKGCASMLADKSRPRIIFTAPNRAELADRADLRFRGPLKNQRRGRGTSEDPSGCREVMRHYIARGLRSGESTESGQGDCGRGRNMFLRRWCNITGLLKQYAGPRLNQRSSIEFARRY